MKLTFSEQVTNHRFSLKCIPHDTDMQRIEQMSVSVYPDHIISEDIDSYGNITIFGYTNEYHRSFGFDVNGIAFTGLSEYEKAKDLHKVGMYRYQTRITAPGPSIRAFFDKIQISESDSTKDIALHMMEMLSDSFQYGQGCTDMETTAEQALSGGVGVCQDYAHIMLSLCRIKRIPCRYVTGMLLGEGRSHAWVEVWVDNRWIGLDPTNRQLVNEDYIKISNGRDSQDCLVNQGIFTGNVTQTQEISVLVEEVTDGTDIGIS
jgi:transglutaminase-like putative cysteine protease